MKKKIICFWTAVMGIAIIIIVLFITAVALLISNKPDTAQLEPLNYTAWFSANKKVSCELKYLSSNHNFTKEKTVEFTKDEINSLLYMSITANNAYSYQNERKYKIEYVNFSGTEFTVYISYLINFNTPFGNIINFKISFIPGIENDNLEIKTLSCKFGDIPVPAGIVNYLFDKNKSEMKKNKMIDGLLKAVKLMEIKNNSFVITYIPAEAAKLMATGLVLK